MIEDLVHAFLACPSSATPNEFLGAPVCVCACFASALLCFLCATNGKHHCRIPSRAPPETRSVSRWRDKRGMRGPDPQLSSRSVQACHAHDSGMQNNKTK